MKIIFDKTKLADFADRYQYATDETITRIGDLAKKNKYLTKEGIKMICAWKTPRSKPKVESNDEKYIEEITKIALTSNSDRLRIEILNLLKGVGWPTASTILHFCHTEPFPILDFRALYSLGYDSTPIRYDYDLWREYTDYCRMLARSSGLDMRTVDRGLWQYSKENQKKR